MTNLSNEDVDKYIENLDRMKKAEKRHIKWLIKVGVICGVVIAISLGFLSCGNPFIGG